MFPNLEHLSITPNILIHRWDTPITPDDVTNLLPESLKTLTIVEPSIDHSDPGNYIYETIMFLHDMATFYLLESLAKGMDRRGKCPGEGLKVVNFVVEYDEYTVREDFWRCAYPRREEESFGFITKMFADVGIEFVVYH